VRRIVRSILKAFLIVLLGFIANNCTFDPGGCINLDSRFNGCFRGNDLGGVTMTLDTDACDNLEGTLFLNQDTIPEPYAVQGAVESLGFAKLKGTSTLNPESPITIKAFLSQTESMTIQINDGPPSDPLTRCPDEDL
jgi:hypothetical protein